MWNGSRTRFFARTGSSSLNWLRRVMNRGFRILIVGIAIMLSDQVACAAMSKGHEILVRRGLQIQGMVTRDDVFNLNTYTNTGYTSIHWLWDSNPSQMGVAPGFPWSRWAG